ncbi:hypothetical protein C8N24_0494 [Solirubrobacter pauli]|uniref:Uncharacterized protein n=1 Tax=Solirubrobacter pauli TaxID=166793 RepID=A0A660LD93_9ACTN|nr:hypothetical protein [Solirubrobacter pauli]RKQ90681.1 hypothetical protein C8N24_0494 [Solirubrobacter pauli]
MFSVKTRRVAVPMVVACVGVLGSATAAHAQSGGLSVTPASLENRAKLGSVGSLTLNNTTRETLRVTVTVRPWRQQLNGTVVADPRSNLTRYVRATTRTFNIGAGAKRPVSFRMVRRLSSLYASVDILGKPTNTKGRKGIIPNYRLISKLRLNPAKKTYKFRTGAAQVRSGSVILPVRNLGNSIDPIGGSYRISGPSSKNGNAAAISALPGKLVGLNLGSTRGMKKGRYTVTATVKQGSRSANVRTSFTIR